MVEGIELRKVEEKSETERRGKDVDGAGGVGGLFDVQMILEMRRRVLECEDDSDADDDEGWDA